MKKLLFMLFVLGSFSVSAMTIDPNLTLGEVNVENFSAAMEMNEIEISTILKKEPCYETAAFVVDNFGSDTDSVYNYYLWHWVLDNC